VRPDDPPAAHARGIRCAEAIELVTLHLDAALDEHDRRLFEQHVGSCTGCTRFAAQIRLTIELTGRVLAHTSAARQPRHDELRAAFVARRGAA
jgi:hypothetical protein